MGWGVLLAGALRWGPRHRRIRPFLVLGGLNVTAFGILLAILVASSEPGGLAKSASGWTMPAVVGAVVACAGFRFPRTLGLLEIVVAIGVFWWGSSALSSFRPADAPYRDWTAQASNDQELGQIFSVSIDEVRLPSVVPSVWRSWTRWRPGDLSAPEGWWSWAEKIGWARSMSPQPPSHARKWEIYRLVGTEEGLSWTRVAPQSDPFRP